jgi:hypothetical protein
MHIVARLHNRGDSMDSMVDEAGRHERAAAVAIRHHLAKIGRAGGGDIGEQAMSDFVGSATTVNAERRRMVEPLALSGKPGAAGACVHAEAAAAWRSRVLGRESILAYRKAGSLVERLRGPSPNEKTDLS